MMKLIAFIAFVAFSCALAIPGGYQEVDVDEVGVIEAAKHGTKELGDKFSSLYLHKLVKVKKAEQQVVAGINYRLKVIVGLTTCKKAEVNYEDVESCDLQDSVSTYKKCDIVVYRNLQGDHKLMYKGCILASKTDLY